MFLLGTRDSCAVRLGNAQCAAKRASRAPLSVVIFEAKTKITYLEFVCKAGPGPRRMRALFYLREHKLVVFALFRHNCRLWARE